jgi:hypothetical protein
MTSIFDGMAGALNDMFGAPVFWLRNGMVTTIRAVFREEPVEMVGDAGPVIVKVPTLQVPRNIASGIASGQQFQLADGRVYRVESQIQSASPAADGFVVCTLERVT